MSNVIGQSITLSNGVTAPNRFLKSAMTERLASWGIEFDDRGVPGPEYEHLYRLWGEGGTGIIVFGNVPWCVLHLPAILAWQLTVWFVTAM